MDILGSDGQVIFREKRRVLIEERSFVTTLPTSATTTYDYATPIVRPPFLKHAGLNAEAREAVPVGDPYFLWTIRGSAGDIQAIRTELTIQRYAKQGGWGTADFIASFPDRTLDVTGAFLQNRGVIGYDAKGEGTIRGLLQVTNLLGVEMNLAILIQVFGYQVEEGEANGDPSGQTCLGRDI